jgi:hypothetical protein
VVMQAMRDCGGVVNPWWACLEKLATAQEGTILQWVWHEPHDASLVGMRCEHRVEAALALWSECSQLSSGQSFPLQSVPLAVDIEA